MNDFSRMVRNAMYVYTQILRIGKYTTWDFGDEELISNGWRKFNGELK